HRSLLVERVDEGRVQVRTQLHIGLVDRLPAGDRGAVEHRAIGEEVVIDEVDVEGHVLQSAADVGEAHVDVFDVLFLDLSKDISSCGHSIIPLKILDVGMGQMACAPVSPVLMRRTSMMSETKILPSPIRPVRAADTMASKAGCSWSSSTTTSILILGRKSTTYSAPR